MTPIEVFYPSSEYQLVPDWALIPLGGEGWVNETTQKRWWRWSDPVPGPETVIDKRTGLPQQIPPAPPTPEPKHNSQADSAKSAKKSQAKDDKGTPEVSYAQDEPKPQARPHAGLPTSTFPPKNQRPCFVNYWTDFLAESRHYNAGVYYHRVETRKNAAGQDIEVLVNEWFMSPAEVDAITRIEGSREHSYILEYIPHGETERCRMLLPQSLLVGRPDELAKLLRDRGLSVLHQHKTQVRDYLDSRHKFFSAKRPENFWDCVKVTGWHNGAFVLPNEIIGKTSGIYFDPKGEVAKYGKAGTLEEWKNKIARLAVGNPYLVFGISSSLAGPLLKNLGLPGVGFHLLGDSTSGKTTALIVSTSVWGSPEFLLSWRTTVNNLEAQCGSRSDTVIIIDESHLAEPRHLDAAIYVVVHGASKGRLNRDATAKDIMRWRVVLLSSGERALETHLAAAGIDHKAGQWVRIIDLPAKGAFGLFDDLHSYSSGAQFADILMSTAADSYGYVGPAFVERLIEELPSLALGEKLAQTIATYVGALSAQQARAWRSFAIVALAGELASLWGILPWQTGTALCAATKLFQTWLADQPLSAASREQAQILKCISDAIDTHGDSRFSDLNWTPPHPNKYNEEPPKIHNRLGYWEDTSAGRIYLFTSAGLHEVTKGFDWKRVLRALGEAGAFTEKGSDGEKAKKRDNPDGESVKLYHIDRQKLQPSP